MRVDEISGSACIKVLISPSPGFTVSAVGASFLLLGVCVT